MRRIVPLLLIALSVVAFFGCEDFSLFAELAALAGGPLAIFPSAAVVTTDGTFAFSAVGGMPPYDFVVTTGPATGSVAVSGAPSIAIYTAPASEVLATVRLTDAEGTQREARVNVVGQQNLEIVPTAVTLAAGSAPFTFQARGGSPPYTFSKVSGDGTITPAGLYTPPAGAGTDNLRVTDGAGSKRDATVTVVVASGGSVTISPSAVQVPDSGSFTFTIFGGTLPYSTQVTTGPGAMIGWTYFPASASSGDTGIIVEVTDSTTPAPYFDSATVTIVPGTPTNLVADGTVAGNDTIQLTWQDNAATETEYRIYMKREANPFDPPVIVGPNTAPLVGGIMSHLVGGLIPNQLYTFYVEAYGGGQSAASNYHLDIPNR